MPLAVQTQGVIFYQLSAIILYPPWKKRELGHLHLQCIYLLKKLTANHYSWFHCMTFLIINSGHFY